MAESQSTNLKTCPKCKQAKPHNNFTREARRPDGCRPHCRSCDVALRAATAEQTNRRKRQWRIDNRFRETLHQSRRNSRSRGHQPCAATEAEIVAAFDGRCRLCHRPELPGEHPLRLDHCHVTGRFRGWLCHWCNVGIGMLNEDPAIMERAIEYVRDQQPTVRPFTWIG